VAQIDKVTQQNAANAEESASASEELNTQAESMKEMVHSLVVLVGTKTAKRNKDDDTNPLEVEHESAEKTQELLDKHQELNTSDSIFHNIAGEPTKMT